MTKETRMKLAKHYMEMTEEQKKKHPSYMKHVEEFKSQIPKPEEKKPSIIERIREKAKIKESDE